MVLHRSSLCLITFSGFTGKNPHVNKVGWGGGWWWWWWRGVLFLSKLRSHFYLPVQNNKLTQGAESTRFSTTTVLLDPNWETSVRVLRLDKPAVDGRP